MNFYVTVSNQVFWKLQRLFKHTCSLWRLSKHVFIWEAFWTHVFIMEDIQTHVFIMEYVQTHVFIMEVVQTHVFIMEDVQTHVFLPKAVSYFEALSKKTVTFPISIFIVSQLKYIYILHLHFYDYRCQSNNSINKKKALSGEESI